MNSIRLTLVMGLTALLMTAGCIYRVQQSPLDATEGWRFLLLKEEREALNPAIKEDYQGYIRQLPEKHRRNVGTIELFGDGKGYHAVTIAFAIDGTRWTHVLFYDKLGKRIRFKKYVSGHYRS